jgi:hypothetical protein
MMHLKGIYRYTCGRAYFGGFIEDYKSGRCTIVYANGASFKAI